MVPSGQEDLGAAGALGCSPGAVTGVESCGSGARSGLVEEAENWRTRGICRRSRELRRHRVHNMAVLEASTVGLVWSRRMLMGRLSVRTRLKCGRPQGEILGVSDSALGFLLANQGLRSHLIASASPVFNTSKQSTVVRRLIKESQLDIWY
jgi:hypothetical protein